MPRCDAAQFVIALDQVGGDDARFRQDAESNAALTQAIWAQADTLGYGDTFLAEAAPATTNAHTPFALQGTPTTLITDVGYVAGDTLADTVDRLSEQTLLRVGRTLEVWLEGARVGGLEVQVASAASGECAASFVAAASAAVLTNRVASSRTAAEVVHLQNPQHL